MRHKIVVAGFTVAALVVAGPAFAQSTMTDKAKSVTQEAKTGMSDSWVTSKTKIALFSDDRVKGRQVHVETKDGVVYLRGKVDSSEAKAAATDIASTWRRFGFDPLANEKRRAKLKRLLSSEAEPAALSLVRTEHRLKSDRG